MEGTEAVAPLRPTPGLHALPAFGFQPKNAVSENQRPRQTLHVPPCLAQFPQAEQFLQAVHTPEGEQAPARSAKGAATRARMRRTIRGNIRAGLCRLFRQETIRGYPPPPATFRQRCPEVVPAGHLFKARLKSRKRRQNM